MSLSEATKQATRGEWHELGFYYKMTKDPPAWCFVGSLSGLANFVQLLDDYVGNPANAKLSEHEHYGPYMYLKVQTAEEPAVDSDGIRGSIKDLARLRELIAAKLARGTVGQRFEVGAEYSEAASFPLQFEISGEEFDPASADPLL
jgi:hypothetical protein